MLSFLILYKMVSLDSCGEPTDEELEILLSSLKPGKKLPPLNDFFHPADYIEQLIAENYLDGLLEGYTVEFAAFNSIGNLKGVSYLSFKVNERLKRIYLTMCKVIKLRGLDLKFEHKYEVWSLPLNGPC